MIMQHKVIYKCNPEIFKYLRLLHFEGEMLYLNSNQYVLLSYCIVLQNRTEAVFLVMCDPSMNEL